MNSEVDTRPVMTRGKPVERIDLERAKWAVAQVMADPNQDPHVRAVLYAAVALGCSWPAAEAAVHALVEAGVLTPEPYKDSKAAEWNYSLHDDYLRLRDMWPPGVDPPEREAGKWSEYNTVDHFRKLTPHSARKFQTLRAGDNPEIRTEHAPGVTRGNIRVYLPEFDKHRKQI